MSPGLDAVVITVSMLAVFGLTMTGLNLLAGHGLPGLQVWVEERSPMVYGLTILIFCVVLVSVGRIDVPRLMVAPNRLSAGRCWPPLSSRSPCISSSSSSPPAA